MARNTRGGAKGWWRATKPPSRGDRSLNGPWGPPRHPIAKYNNGMLKNRRLSESAQRFVPTPEQESLAARAGLPESASTQSECKPAPCAYSPCLPQSAHLPKHLCTTPALKHDRNTFRTSGLSGARAE